MASTDPTPPCLCDDLRGDGLCLVCASTPEDRKETPAATVTHDGLGYDVVAEPAQPWWLNRG